MKYLLTIGSILLLLSCETTPSHSNENSYKVAYRGALKNMMHKGDISSKADLSELKNVKNLYALGAIENLKGEIQIFNGQAFNTMVEKDTLIFDTTFQKKATLLVYSSVDTWSSIPVPSNILTAKQLEQFIEATAKKQKIDIHKPFPFLLDGKVKSFDWHVINWKEGDTEHSHEKHINSGLHGTITDREVNMLGFYSNAHHAIFTHHTTNMHIHVKTVDGKMAGHVDDLNLGEKMILKLPEVNVN